MTEVCGKMVRRGIMIDYRPCYRIKNHSSYCAPNLVGVKFGYGIVISRNLDNDRLRWNFKNRFGQIYPVEPRDLWKGSNKGAKIRSGSGFGSRKGNSLAPEYRTVHQHYNRCFNLGIIYLTISRRRNLRNALIVSLTQLQARESLTPN